jgi:two-component system response regulator YcbB
MRIYLIDDDEAILTMLDNIISDYDIGQVVGKSTDGEQALKDLNLLKPDIVVVDLLIPRIDGVEIVTKAKQRNAKTQFIMLSQVTSKSMVGDAYRAGIEFFINKPINVMEVKTVLEKAIEKANLQSILLRIQETVKVGGELPRDEDKNQDGTLEQITEILSDLGIVNERGGQDILSIVSLILEERVDSGQKYQRYNIGDMYNRLHEIYHSEDYNGSFNVRAIEQRVRRTIQQAMDNVSMLGVEDFSHYKFERYSSRLFDFIEIKRNMDFIRKKSNYRGKISVKTFIEGLISMVED